MEQENKKAADNALFKKLEEISIKMPSDPILYKDDVENYKQLFKLEFEKLQGQTMKKNQRFGELLIFLAKSVRFFPEQLGFIPTTTMSLMNELGKSLHPYIRKKCISAIMILRAKNILYPISTIEFLLKQFNIEDKELRKILYKYILNDVRRMNKHHQNNKINQELKKFISQYITKYSDKTAQKSLQLMIEFYRRNIWTDNRTVNIVADGCFNASAKVRLIACYFLISTTETLDPIEESDSDDEVVDPSEIKWKKGVRRHTKNKEKKLEKEKRRAERRLRKKEIIARRTNFMPIDLIYNPQEFAEKLFNLMNQKSTKFSHKILYMALIARIIWRHKLIMLPFYGALQKYMDPRQKEAPKVLAYFAQSVHDLVPDDEIEPIVKHIIETFVNDKCSEFTMTIGLNTIREIYSKVCSIITEDAMTYLCTYYEYKNKNVSTAAKSVINLVREINPYLLEKKFRGKFSNSEPLDMMKEIVSTRIKGAELLGADKGDIPVEMDKIFTDEDFKKIRKLIRKRQEDGDDLQEINEEELEINSDQFVEVDEEQGQDENQSELSSEGEEVDDEDMEEIDWDDAEEVEEEGDQDEDEEEVEDDNKDQEENQEEMEEQVDEQEEEQDSSQGDQEKSEQELEWNSQDIQEEFQQEDEQQNPKKKSQPKKTKPIQKEKEKQNKKPTQPKKPKANQQHLYSDSGSDEESEEQNPHGFIDLNRIAFYKRSKTQIKAERKRNPEAKEKFKHKPKDKKGGTSNEEKAKLKPIMMLRAKKNKLKLREKQVKLRIKNLKTQLGKVRSNKQAKKLKNKQIKKA